MMVFVQRAVICVVAFASLVLIFGNEYSVHFGAKSNKAHIHDSYVNFDPYLAEGQHLNVMLEKKNGVEVMSSERLSYDEYASVYYQKGVGEVFFVSSIRADNPPVYVIRFNRIEQKKKSGVSPVLMQLEDCSKWGEDCHSIPVDAEIKASIPSPKSMDFGKSPVVPSGFLLKNISFSKVWFFEKDSGAQFLNFLAKTATDFFENKNRALYLDFVSDKGDMLVHVPFSGTDFDRGDSLVQIYKSGFLSDFGAMGTVQINNGVVQMSPGH